MTKEQFRRQYNYVNAIYSGDYILFKVSKRRWELYHIPTEETIVFRSFDEFSANKIVAEIMASYTEQAAEFDMPKGDRSGATDTFGGDDNASEPDHTKNDFPSRVNTDKQRSSEDKTLQQFRSMYANADKEHGFAVDEQGYVTTYKHGNAHSVSWSNEELTGKMIYHNHPSGGNFSKADMLSTARTGARGVVASGKNGDYIFRKTQKFDAVGFQKAVSSAKTTAKDYNTGVDRWLKHNAKKYGYTYEFRKA